MKPPFVSASLKIMKYPPEGNNQIYGNAVYLVKSVNNIWMQARTDTRAKFDLPFDITCFAELPTVDFDAEEFGFETANALMKTGISCICISVNPDIAKHYDGLGEILCRNTVFSDKIIDNHWHEQSFTVAEINGRWRLA